MHEAQLTPQMPRLYRGLARVIGPLVRAYSRVELIGREHLPAGGVILAANHPGSLWWDALCLAAGLAPRGICFVANAWDFRFRLMGALLERVGTMPQATEYATIDDRDPVVQALRGGHCVTHFPEESYHSFWRRYTLYRFAPHTLRYAQCAGVPVVPTAIVGVEEAAATLFGPKRAGTPLHFPLIPPLVLPLKIKIEFGPPLKADELLAGEASTDAQTYEGGAKRLQQAVGELLARHRRTTVCDDGYLEQSGWW